MNLSSWQFKVLSPIFTMHRGMQKKKGRPTWRERQNSNNRNKFEHFKKEIFAKYNKDYIREAKKEHEQERKDKKSVKTRNEKAVKENKEVVNLKRRSAYS